MAFDEAKSAFELAGLDPLDGNPQQHENWKDNPFWDKVGEGGATWNPSDLIAQITDPKHFGKGAHGYHLTTQPSDSSYAAHSLNYKGIAPSSSDFPDGFLNNMFDNANWKSLTPQAQGALYNKAFVGDYLWDVKKGDKPNVTAGMSNPTSDKTWGTSHDSTHGLDIARVAIEEWEPGTGQDFDLWRMDKAKNWKAGAEGNPGANMDTLYKHMTEGEIDWAHYNGDGLYQAAAWQLDQDGNKNWIDQSASGFSTVDQIRSADQLLGTMNAQEEAELLDTWTSTSFFGPSVTDTVKDDAPTVKDDVSDYQSMNPKDTQKNDGTWKHKNTEGNEVKRHYTPTYQQTNYQLPDPGDPLKFIRVDESDPRAGQWDSASNTLVWGGKDIDVIKNTKLTPRSDIVPPTLQIPSNMTQQIYRPDNLPANVYGTITSDARWTDPKTGNDKFAAGGKSQSLTIRDGKLIKGDTYTPRSQNLSDMTIKAGGKK